MGNATYKKTLNCRRPLPDDGEPDAEEADAPRAVGKLRGELFMFQKVIAISLTAFIVVAAIFSQQAYPKLKVEDYLAGKFSVPVGDQHSPSEEADTELIAILHWIEAKEQADNAEGEVFEDSPSKELMRRKYLEETLQVGALLDFCEKRKNTDAALTALLVLPYLCSNTESGHNPHRPVFEAMETVLKRFPKTWQAFIVPLEIGAVREKRVIVSAEEDKAGLDRFIAMAPPRDFVFPEDSEIFKRIAKFLSLKTPIRAIYLDCVGSHYWSNALSGSTKEKERRLRQLDQAEKAYQRVIDEYPDSDHGKRAKKAITEEIPRVREHIKDGLM